MSSPVDSNFLLESALDWALANGLVMRAPGSSGPPPSSFSVVHAPFALNPSVFPAAEYHKVVSVQPIWNTLVDRIAKDAEFLEQVMEQWVGDFSFKVHRSDSLAPTSHPTSVYSRYLPMIDHDWLGGFASVTSHPPLYSLGKYDDFTGRIYDIYKTAKREGRLHDIRLGLHRSDYMIHAPHGIGKVKGETKLYQVEINTIASSFSSLSSKVSDLHRWEQTGCCALSSSSLTSLPSSNLTTRFTR